MKVTSELSENPRIEGADDGGTYRNYIDCTLGSDKQGTYILIKAKQPTSFTENEGYTSFFLVDGDTWQGIEFWVKVTAASGSSSSSGGSSGGSGASGSSYAKATESSGEWVVGEKGWWYRFKDGSYPSNGWMQLEWRGKTGWHQIGGKWYYFSTVSGGWNVSAVSEAGA